MKLIYKIFKLNPDVREDVVTATSTLGIIANILIASTKVIIGLLSSSIAIISEGVNNAADVFTSLLTLLGTKLSLKHPDEKHPFGYGRIEFLTGLVIAVLITVTGIEMLKDSVNLIFHPAELNISILSLVIVACSAVIKFLLGIFTMKEGEKVDSSALVGVGLECRNDSFASVVTIISSLLFIIFNISIDAYAGLFISFLILKAGYSVLKDTVSELIGRPGAKDLADKLYKEIRGTDGIINAVDMMLHNYGPDRYSGSVNVEIDHNKSVGEAYQFLHELQLHLMHKYNVVMVFGIYAVDNDNEQIRNIRAAVASYVREHDHVISYHALYLENNTDNLYCDLIVDYKLSDWDELRNDFKKYMKGICPDKKLILTVETEFV